MRIIQKLTIPLIVACFALASLEVQAAEETIATPLLTQPLPEMPGKEVLMLTVTYPPGAADPVHRHDAHGFIYVLEGSIVMQVRGGEEVTLTPGQTYYESPQDVHVVGRNASLTEPARFLVLLIKDSDKPALILE